MKEPATDFTSPAEVREKLKEAVKDAFEPKRKLVEVKSKEATNASVVWKKYNDGEEAIIIRLYEEGRFLPELIIINDTDRVNFKSLKEYAFR